MGLHRGTLRAMKKLHSALLAFLCVASFSVAAQWIWVDKDGRKVFSDRPPPADIADKSILKQPLLAKAVSTSPAAAMAGVDVPAGAASAASAAKPALAKTSGKDAGLEAKKKEAEAQEAAKKKAEDEKNKLAKADNCDRARKGKATLDSGIRIQSTNDKGEREFMSDTGRAAEGQRLSEILKDCA